VAAKCLLAGLEIADIGNIHFQEVSNTPGLDLEVKLLPGGGGIGKLECVLLPIFQDAREL
jgi:hypothetical protein